MYAAGAILLSVLGDAPLFNDFQTVASIGDGYMAANEPILYQGVTVIVCSPEATEIPGAACVTAPAQRVSRAALGTLNILAGQLLSYRKATVDGCDPDAPTGLTAWIKL